MITFNKEKNKDFIILNLTDPQLSDGDWDNAHAVNILKNTVYELVERVSPDLITVSGDMAYCGHNKAYGLFAEFLDSFNIPWSVVFGNHDNQEGPEYVAQALEIFRNSKNFVFEEGDPEIGCGNFVFSVEDEGTPVYSLVMLDSHDRESHAEQPDERYWFDGVSYREWARLSPEQIDWLDKTLSEAEDRGCTESAILMHIPNYSYRYAAEAAYREDADRRNLEAANAHSREIWNEGYEDSEGVVREGICSSLSDEGLLEMLLTHGSCKAIIAGHDHVNNFIITYKGIKHIYALKTGLGCYANEDLNGGTVISIGDKVTYRHEYVKMTDVPHV